MFAVIGLAFALASCQGEQQQEAAPSTEECEQAAVAVAGAATGVDHVLTGEPAALKDFSDDLEAYAPSVPDDARSDFGVVRDGYGSLVDALSENGYDFTSKDPPSQEASAALQAKASELKAGGFEEAAKRLREGHFASC